MKKIMFSDRYGLTQAVIEGRKTMTRREVKAPRRFRGQDVNGYWVYRHYVTREVVEVCMKDYDDAAIEGGQIRPKYDFDEIVAVAQSYEQVYHQMGLETMDMVVSGMKTSAGWTNKMFVKSELMPHRIRITGIKCERLQDISDEDCFKEGINASNSHEIGYGIPWVYEFAGSKKVYYTPREAFAELIDKVSGKGTWASNPWVMAYEFELVK